MPRILIADDHVLLRAGLRMTLASAFPDSYIEECGTWAAVQQCVDARRFDLILLDLFMPRRHAWEDELRRFMDAVPDTAVCILSASAEPAHIRTAVATGVRAYLTKTLGAAELIALLRRALAGEVLIPDLDGPAALPTGAGPEIRLTPRQQAILARLAAGARNREIADALGLTEATVKRHVLNICQRLGATNRVQAVALARACGLLAHDY